MKTTAISTLKASLSRYLGIVKAGEEVVITDRGKPVAKIVPLERGELKIPPHLVDLERSGLVHIGSGKITKGFWELPRPKDLRGSALEALLKERETAR